MPKKTVQKSAKRRGVAVEQIYKVLHKRIINGTYPPGIRMSQIELATELATSRTPLREALNRLQANGLVIANSNRGMVVAPVHYAKTEQWYALRLLVEPAIIASIIDEITDADIAAMAEALGAMQENRHRAQAYQQSHYRFHEIALRQYPEAIREIIETMFVHIARHQSHHFSHSHVAQDFINLDQLLLKAFRARDAELARHVLEFHLLDAGLGLALDIEPDRMPHALLTAVRGLGMQLTWQNGHLIPPARVTWRRGLPCPLPSLKTMYLEYYSDPVP
jgi:DNA-binding GntR family transcriptional regulator